MSTVNIREIQPSDVASVVDLLVEGFPSRRRAYWKRGFQSMARRRVVDGCPQFGLLMFADDRVVGTLLSIWSVLDGTVRCNPSSWYVQESFRSHSLFMLMKMMMFQRDATYLDLTPAPATERIVRGAGFKPYTAGTWIVNCCLSLSRAKVHVASTDVFNSADVGTADAEILNRHLVYGCSGVTIRDARGSMPALYRTKRYKGLVPIASFLAGDTSRLLSAAPEISRYLLARGIPLALIDAPINTSRDEVLPRGVTLDRNRGVRYMRGSVSIRVGDLRECELAVFGP